MDIEFIVEIVMLFGVYIVVGMIISYIVNDISYLAYDYFWLVTILYPIILPILLYFELKEYKKHQERANERRYRSGEESWHRGSVVAKKK